MTKPFKSTHIREHTGTHWLLSFTFNCLTTRVVYILCCYNTIFVLQQIFNKRSAWITFNVKYCSLFRTHPRSGRIVVIIHSAVCLTWTSQSKELDSTHTPARLIFFLVAQKPNDALELFRNTFLTNNKILWSC